MKKKTDHKGGDSVKRILSVENINEAIARDPRGFVLECEERYHRELTLMATDILRSCHEKPFILISGPSGSGKTTTARRLERYLTNYSVKVYTIGLDDYFLPITQRPEFVEDFESPYCVDLELLRQDLGKLRRGESVTLPRFHFAEQTRSWGETIRLEEKAVVIMEGIHALNPLLTEDILPASHGIYVAPGACLECEGHLLQPKQLRLARRLLRDHYFRGRSFEQIVRQAREVDAGEDRYIRPFKKNASMFVDTYMDYELPVFVSLMCADGSFSKKFDPAFVEENKLQALLLAVESFAPLGVDYVPRNSLVREFIGDSSVLT